MLNRIVRWTSGGWEIEPDQRHVDLIVQEMAMDKAKGVITPGEKDPRGKDVEADEELSPSDTTRYLPF